jgi:hypothetical protein
VLERQSPEAREAMLAILVELERGGVQEDDGSFSDSDLEAEYAAWAAENDDDFEDAA